MSIKQAHIDLDNRGLVLIQGVNNDNPSFMSNGSGKSTIIEGIVYVLFGRTLRGVKGDDVVSNVSKKNCKVVLDFIDDNNVEYRVARYRKHHQNKNSVYLFCNGTDVTPKSESDFTKKIIELLQTDFMTFTSSILYSAESFKFTQATDSELKSAFDVMLDLKVYSNCQEEVKSQLRELSSKMGEFNTRKMKIEQKKSTIEESYNETKMLADRYAESKEQLLDQLREELNDNLDKVIALDESIQQVESDIKSLTDEIKELQSTKKSSGRTEKALEDLKKALSDSEDEKDSIQKRLRKTRRILAESEDNLTELVEGIEEYKDKIEELKQKISELNDTVGTPCPVCGKPLDKEHIADALAECKNQISKIKEDITDAEAEISEEKKSIKAYKEDIESMESDIHDIDEEISEFARLRKKVQEKLDIEMDSDRKIIAAEKQCNRLERSYNEYTVNKESINNKIKSLSERIAEEEKQDNPYLVQLDSFTDKIKDIDHEMELLSEEIEPLIAEEKVLNFWLDGFSNSGIKSMLLDDITPFLNKRANKYLKILSGDKLSVNFTTQTRLKSGELRDKFQIELVNDDGGDSYLSNSSGEKRRVDVAINLALCDLIASRANNKMNIAFYDEIFDALDTVGVESVMDLLRDMSKEKSSIFVISHNDQIKSYFDKTLTVTKKDGCSTVEFEG